MALKNHLSDWSSLYDNLTDEPENLSDLFDNLSGSLTTWLTCKIGVNIRIQDLQTQIWGIEEFIEQKQIQKIRVQYKIAHYGPAIAIPNIIPTYTHWF